MMDDAKAQIIKIFMQNVYGKSPNVSSFSAKHDGKYGHWLEDKMGVTHNADNAPDLLGYEMKNDTLSRTSFGDWMPDKKIFGKDCKISRNDFVKIFGQRSSAGPERWSWSGNARPRINCWNIVGQQLRITQNKDIVVVYSYDKDERPEKDKIVPQEYRNNEAVLMMWSHNSMSQKVENKFNQKGWFKCLRDKKSGLYNKIVFGDPINYDKWIERVKTGEIFFDPGMYYDAKKTKTNTRNYMMWRANNVTWMDAITESYPKK